MSEYDYLNAWYNESQKLISANASWVHNGNPNATRPAPVKQFPGASDFSTEDLIFELISRGYVVMDAKTVRDAVEGVGG